MAVEPSGPIAVVTKVCPGCGVAVPAGYPKCPRCHTELPQTLPGETRRRTPTDMGGGTTMSPGPERTLIYIGVAAIGLIAVVTWLMVRGGPTKPAAAATGSDDSGASDTDDGTTGDTDEAQPEPPPDRAPVQPRPPPDPDDTPAAQTAAAAAAELGRELRSERLWATVTIDATTVVVDSSFCDDAGLGAILSSHTGALRDAGLTDVRCRAPHGGVVFERGL